MVIHNTNYLSNLYRGSIFTHFLSPFRDCNLYIDDNFFHIKRLRAPHEVRPLKGTEEKLPSTTNSFSVL